VPLEVTTKTTGARGAIVKTEDGGAFELDEVDGEQVAGGAQGAGEEHAGGGAEGEGGGWGEL
jgi:hypothetical protein